MKINNDISLARIKRALGPKTVLVVCLMVALLSGVLYVTLQNSDDNAVRIWYVTADSDGGFSAETAALLEEYGAGAGIGRIVTTRRSPDDKYFDVIMSTSAYSYCDIFIMTEDVAQKYAESGLFMSLQSAPAEELLYAGSDVIGIAITDTHYLLINAETEVDLDILYGIIELLTTQ